MQEDTAHKAQQHADHCENVGFAVDVGLHLALKEAQHLDGGDFLCALGDIDVHQVVQYHKSQHAGTQDDHVHDIVDARDGVVQTRAHAAHLREARYPVHLQQGCGEGFVHILRIVGQDAQHRVVFQRAAVGVLINGGRHIHIIFHIIFRYARDGECALPAFAVFQRERVPGRKARFVAELFRDDHAVVCQRYGCAAFAFMQVDKIVQPCFILGYKEVYVIALAVHIQRNALLLYGQVARDLFGSIHQRLESGILQGALFAQCHEEIIGEHLAELFGYDVADGVLQAEARHQQRRTASHADDRHEKALFVSEQVARRHLVGELHALPYRCDALQEDTLACLGRFGQKELCGPLFQRLAAGVQCGGAGAQERRAHAQHGQRSVEQTAEPGDGIHGAVGVPDDDGNDRKAEGKAGSAAHQCGHPGVEQVFEHDLPALVSQCLQRADLQAFFLHHARHGGKGHQRGHQEEENGEHRGDGLQLIHIGKIRGRAHVGGAVQDHPFRNFQLRQLLLPVRDLSLGVGQLLLHIFFLFFVFRLAVFQLGFAVLQLGQAVLILRLGGIQL